MSNYPPLDESPSRLMATIQQSNRLAADAHDETILVGARKEYLPAWAIQAAGHADGLMSSWKSP